MRHRRNLSLLPPPPKGEVEHAPVTPSKATEEPKPIPEELVTPGSRLTSKLQLENVKAKKSLDS